MSMIIIEGPDGSGKTTLIQQMRTVSDRSFTMVRRSGPPSSLHEIEQLMSWLDHRPPDLNMVIDRHPLISEKIYGPVLRSEDRLQHLTWAHIGVWLHTQGLTTIIYCRPRRERIATNLAKQPQLKGVEAHLNEIIGMYDARMYAFRQQGLHVIDYDYELHNPELMIKKAWEGNREPRTNPDHLHASAGSDAEVLTDRGQQPEPRSFDSSD